MNESFPQQESPDKKPSTDGQILYRQIFRSEHVADREHNHLLATQDGFLENHFEEAGLILADFGECRALLKEGPYSTLDLMVMLKAPGPEGLCDMSVPELQRHYTVVETIRGELQALFPNSDFIIGTNQGLSQSVKLLHTHITSAKGEYLPYPEKFVKAMHPQGYYGVKGMEEDALVMDKLVDSIKEVDPTMDIRKEGAVIKVKMNDGSLGSLENALLIKIVAEQLEMAREGILTPDSKSLFDKEWGSALSISEDNEIVMATRPTRVGMLEVNGFALQRQNSNPTLPGIETYDTASEALKLACVRAKEKLAQNDL